MKKRIIQLTIMFSKHALWLLVSYYALFSVALANEGKGQHVRNINEVMVQVEFKNSKILDVFKNVELQTGYDFVFHEKDIDPLVKIDIQNQTLSLADLLYEVSKVSSLKFKQVDQNISVYPKEIVNHIDLTINKPLMQQTIVKGKVIDFDGVALPGVNIVEKGTNNGTITNIDGEYSISISDVSSSILVFSFVGFLTEEVEVAGRTTINMTLIENIMELDEVVVTALGIEKSKKSLTYSTQQVDMESLTTVREASLGNALAGKIAGVSITTSTGSTGISGDPRIVIRGDRTIQNNNQPLIVVDGIPYGSDGGGLSSINPDDVQSMNVLKGPAASALYGSSAQNGVIVITTKKGKEGQTQIEVNSSSTFDFPYLYPEFQNEYAQGASGVYQPNADMTSWGPKMSGQTVQSWTGETITLNPQPNNVKDFFVTGYNYTNSVSYSSGSEKSSTYFSYSNVAARGVLEDNKMNRHNFNLRLNTELVKKLNLDFRINYFRQNLKDQPEVGDSHFSPMWQLIKMPRSIRTEDIEDGSYYDEDGALRQKTWNDETTNNVNPYFAMYGYEKPVINNKVNTFVNLHYDFSENLFLQVRGGMNINNSNEEEKKYYDVVYINSGIGDYYTYFSYSQQFNGDILLGYTKNFNEDISLGLNVGAEIKDNQGRSQKSDANGLTAENKFNMDYAYSPETENGESHIQKQAVYGMGNVSFKNYLFLDFTARNDWSSTLPSPYSYFYPSVGLTGVISDMFDLPDFFTFAKLRGSYAEVGNDAKFAIISQTYGSGATGPVGEIYPESTKVADQLIPEKTKSWEIGTDLRFFDNRFGVDLTYYKSNTYNQLLRVTVPSSSGYNRAWINCGNIENKGVELVVNATPIRTSDFDWNISLNFARNKNKVIELTESLDKYEVESPNLSLGYTYVMKGRPFGEIYTVGYERDDEGNVIVDATGKPELESDPETYLGNFNYDWRSGFTSNLSYKNWSMSFLIDLNYGGVRQSATEATMLYCGTSKQSLVGREEGIIVDGVTEDGEKNTTVISAEEYARAIGGRISSGSGEAFNHEATNSRLRELSIGYTIPLNSNVIKSLRVSAVGRNLFYIYNACDWFDPDGSYDVGRNGQGAESSFLPGTRTFGVNIKCTL